jgi:hypothetical protein
MHLVGWIWRNVSPAACLPSSFHSCLGYLSFPLRLHVTLQNTSLLRFPSFYPSLVHFRSDISVTCRSVTLTGVLQTSVALSLAKEPSFSLAHNMSYNVERLDNKEQIAAMREVQWGPDGSATALEWTKVLRKLERDDSRVGY